MNEKTTSKYLLNLEKHFATDHPVLMKAAKAFHDLDQIEYDLGLIEMDETTACKISWWPIVSLIGGNSTAKSRFLNNYLGAENVLSGIQASSHKFTVLLQGSQSSPSILPGTALDVDPRFPFYQISRKIEQQQNGEGNRINSYLELKTLNSDYLKGKLFIDSPNINEASNNPVISLLLKHTIEHSDLVFIFTDTFDSTSPLIDELVATISLYQDSNKFVYLIDAPAGPLNPTRNNDMISSWQRRLSESGLNTGQFIIVPNQEHGIGAPNRLDYAEIDLRLNNVAHDRSYRVLHSLEKSIREIESVIMPEVKKAIVLWKERVNMSSLLVLGFIATLVIFAEIQVGILDFLIDPIIGPLILLIVLAIIIPLHLIISKLQAKLISSRLHARQKELHLMENLANLYEKNLTFVHMLLPLTEPVVWNKKTKARLSQLSDKTKELVQSLNDNFSSYNEPSFKTRPDSADFEDYSQGITIPRT
ncbi:conserved hypothetical protein [Candidatus Methylobacter favarea]|uniref:Dynamin family protein n=1 Tax=Candidatus Methylobacter favarea TaxID=2707345 RepID=A0A8S0XU57_9GAMM|nr:hypothetical protein [Candidatus Methylobacter favarea]CAA9892298.1 conserved hypothetical protein [Candidatus Methylobacter favarea]